MYFVFLYVSGYGATEKNQFLACYDVFKRLNSIGCNYYGL